MQPSVFQILYYSQLLASLTYFLGALIYALPVPVYGIKKWAPKLILDSIYVMVWNSIYLGVLYFMIQLLSMLGVNWGTYFAFLNQMVTAEEGLYLTIETALTILKIFELPSMVYIVPLGQIVTLVLSLMSFTEILITVSELIYSYAGYFIALGVLFLSIPFRIGRSVGGAFIGTSIVFYVGLPYLPQFMQDLGISIYLSTPTPNSVNQYIQLYFEKVIPSIIMAYFLAPTIYIFILLGFSAGLSSLVSGYGSRLPIIVDVF